MNQKRDLVAVVSDSSDAIDAIVGTAIGGAKDALREINRRNRAALASAQGKAKA
jgi:hypothetical protein